MSREGINRTDVGGRLLRQKEEEHLEQRYMGAYLVPGKEASEAEQNEWGWREKELGCQGPGQVGPCK